MCRCCSSGMSCSMRHLLPPKMFLPSIRCIRWRLVDPSRLPWGMPYNLTRSLWRSCRGGICCSSQHHCQKTLLLGRQYRQCTPPVSRIRLYKLCSWKTVGWCRSLQGMCCKWTPLLMRTFRRRIWCICLPLRVHKSLPGRECISRHWIPKKPRLDRCCSWKQLLMRIRLRCMCCM